MASQRHHYIPQFLLKGFASRITNKSHFVYRFGKASPCHEVNIINVAVARSFHEGLNSDLEQRLSYRERNYARVLANLRCQSICASDIDLIAEFVFNSMVRTKNLRDGLTILGKDAIDLLYKPDVQRIFRKRVLSAFAASPDIAIILGRYPKNRRERILITEIARRGINLGAELKRWRDNLRVLVDMDKLTKDAQLKALETEGIPGPRKESFASYYWYVIRQPVGSFILGDVGPLARVPDCDQLTYPLGYGIPLSIYLPISSAELLVGDARPEHEVISVDDINRASADLSRDFLVSSQNTPREQGYSDRLGSRAEFLTKSKLQELLEEVFDELERGN